VNPKIDAIKEQIPQEPYYETENGVLYCGDSRSIVPAIPDKACDMIFTDPPYGHNNNNNGDLISRWEAALGRKSYVPERDNRPIANDGAEANELFKDLLTDFSRVLSPGCCFCCCCGGGGPDPQFARWALWMDEVFDFKQMVVWDKGPMGMGWHYRRSYETILVGMRAGAACRWYDESKRVENVIRPSHGISKIIPSKTQHPTEKPVSLAGHFIQLHSKPGDVVLDPFSGSGSTLDACEKYNRAWIGIELSEEYCAIAAERLRVETAQRKLFA